MRIRTFFGVPAFFVCAVFMQNLLCAQASRFTPNSFVRPDGQKKEPPVLEIAENPKTLPQGYRSIKLGMSVEETKKPILCSVTAESAMCLCCPAKTACL